MSRFPRAIDKPTLAIVGVILAILVSTAWIRPVAAQTSSTTATAARAAGPDLSRVTLRVGDQVNQLQTLLSASGQLAGLPYEVEWAAFSSGPPLVEALNAGAIDAGVVGDTPPIFAQAGGADIKLVAASKAAADGLAIVVPKGSTVKAVADLKGKKVAFARGSAAHAFLLARLAAAKLGPGDVTEVNLQPTDGLAAFNSGGVDAWVIWDPFTALAEKGGATVVENGANGKASGLNYIVARGAVVGDKAQRAALRDFVERVARAGQWRNDHLTEWRDRFVAITGLPPDIALTTLQRNVGGFVPIGESVRKAQQATADRFAGAGVIPAKVDVRDVLYTKYNAAVAAIVGPGAAASSTTATTGGR